MNAKESLLGNLLKGPKQFLIPIYQRPYSWGEKHCSQFFDDVVQLARALESEEQGAHFIGSIVYVERGIYQASTVPELLVIDGQQRLTTFLLFVEALARALEKAGDGASRLVTPRKLRNYFLFNADEDGSARFKLVLSSGDDATLKALVQQKELPDGHSKRVVENFEYFVERIAECGLSIEELYGGLSKLIVVSVALDRNHDNPQLIFESLNSTGMDLSQADLVRNFVLMGLEPAEQSELYEDHWLPMERLLGTGERNDTFDLFLRSWLTMRTADVPNRKLGYETFKRYRRKYADQPIKELVADLHRFARYYARIVLGREENPRLATTWQGLQGLRIDAPIPFFLFAMELEQTGQITEAELLAVAELIENWVLRRSICDVPSNVLSRTFATLPKHLDAANLVDSLGAFLLHRGGRQKFPSDAEFRRALVSRDLYHHKGCQNFLTRLENHDRKELISRGQYTIEHVIPQNQELSEGWREMLGPDWHGVQERVLHTLGNLTLTGYNPELSDSPFVDKREMKGGFKDSPIRMNKSLADRDSWDEDAVLARGAELADKAIAIWPSPKPSKEMWERYDPLLRSGLAAVQAESGKETIKLDEPQLSLYQALEEGLTELGYLPLAQKTQLSFQRPGWNYCPDVACWPKGKKLRVQLREGLAVSNSIPDWFTQRTTGSGSPRVDVDVSTVGQVEAVIQHVEALTESEPVPE